MKTLIKIFFLLAVVFGVEGQNFLEAPQAMFFRAKPAPPAGGGGASVTDNFTRADSNPISNPMSDGSGTWANPGLGWENIKIVSQNCLGNSGNWAAARVSSPTFAANQKSSIKVGSLITDIAPGVRMQTGGGSAGGYFLFTSTTSLQCYRIAATGGLTFTAIGSSMSVSLVTGDVVTLEISGSTLTAKVNGVVKGTVTDATYSTGQPFVSAESDGRITQFTASDL